MNSLNETQLESKSQVKETGKNRNHWLLIPLIASVAAGIFFSLPLLANYSGAAFFGGMMGTILSFILFPLLFAGIFRSFTRKERKRSIGVTTYWVVFSILILSRAIILFGK